jgi:hypothetical protein
VDPNEHANLVFAAQLARRRRQGPEGGQAAAALLANRGGPGAEDPLMARVMNMIAQRRQGRATEQSRADIQRADYDRAMALQGSQQRFAREAAEREQQSRADIQRADYDRAMALQGSQQRFAREAAEREHERAGPTREAELERQAAQAEAARIQQELARRQMENIRTPEQEADAKRREAAESVLLSQDPFRAEQILGVEPPEVSRQTREDLIDRMFADGLASPEDAELVRSARTQADLEKIPGYLAWRDRQRQPLLEEAARMLDESRPGYVSQALGGNEEPWQEPSGVFQLGTYSKQADEALQRAKALMEAHPRFRQHRLTPEDVVKAYRKSD